MDIHKEKCKYLKKVRKALADKLGVDLHQTECTYEGKCSGTCPKCQQEEKVLNTAIIKRGAVTAAIAATAVTLTGCDSDTITAGKIIDTLRQAANKETVELSGEVVPDENFLTGDVAYYPDESNVCETEKKKEEKAESLETFVTEGEVPYMPEEKNE